MSTSERPTPEPPPPGPPRRGRGRWLLAALAVLVPVVPIVIALSLSGSSAPAATATTTQTSAFAPVTHAATQATPARPRHRVLTRLPKGKGAIIGYVSQTETMRSRPGGAGRRIAQIQTRTNFGSPTFLLVTQVKGRWLGVVNTAAGNNRLGWIRSSGVDLRRDRWSLHAHLDRHQLDVYHDGREVRHFPIAVGKPTAPTPTGLYAVTDRLTTGDPEGPYGCCILALSATAPHQISDWDGGNRIAIHSTPETDSIGYSVSHGCMRLSLPAGNWLIHHIPLATPVRISSA